MNLRQAAQQALEALESGDWYIDQLEMLVYSADDTGTHEERAKVQAAITALRAALAEPENQSQSQLDTKVNPAEPEQEPVAWEQFYPDIGKPQTTHWEGCEAVHPECRKPDTIIRLAQEAAFHTSVQEAELLRFAALVVKAERDRICEMLRERQKQEERHNYYGFIANMIEEMP